MDILYYIGVLINEHISIPLSNVVDNLNYYMAEYGYEYIPEYTVFFTLLLECVIVAFLFYISGYIVYLAITTIFRKVFKL